MHDPMRSGHDDAAGDVRERDARIEELLLAGLDHYFAEQHELAINVWTRVLFIDRGHARARAYIERARGAIAERQRKGDELLHSGSAAYDRGDAGAARELVASAVEHGVSHDEALALLARIERLETVTQPPLPAGRRRAALPAAPAAGQVAARRRWPWIAGSLAAGTIMGAAALAVLGARGAIPWPLAPGTTASVPAFQPSLPVPSVGEVAFSRGQMLYARGRLHDALTELGAVPAGDPLRSRADALTASIQRQLLAAGRGASDSNEGRAR